MTSKTLRRFTGVVLTAALLAGCSSGVPRSLAPSTSTASPSVSTSTGPNSVPSTTAPTSIGQPAATVSWSSCNGTDGPNGYQCATLQVPRDPQNPSVGGTIGLALDRRPADGARIGSLLINPGGPGASGVDFLPDAVSLMPKALLARFDIVGFDPPGVSRSAPVRCLPAGDLTRYIELDPAPSSAAGLATVLSESRAFAAGCQQLSGAELPYVSTVDAAMDMDLIRAALGDQKLDYLGFSYGTYLGAVYAGLYPDRIRAMVLDGAIDPSIQPIAELDLQSAGFQTNLEAALAACTASSTCPWHPTGDPMAAFQALLAQVRAHPLKVAGAADALGPAAFLYGVLFTLYSPQYWTYLYQALAQLQAGNGKGLLQLFYAYIERNPDGSYPNLLEAEIAVNCLDVAAPPESAVLADAAHAASLSPFFGVANLYSELQCDVWPVKSPRTPAAVRAAGSPPILVVGSTNDPATPYREAQALASQLASGVLLTRNGYGHTAYPYSSCIRTYVDNYLIDLATPPVGTTCQTG